MQEFFVFIGLAIFTIWFYAMLLGYLAKKAVRSGNAKKLAIGTAKVLGKAVLKSAAKDAWNSFKG